MVAFLRCKDTTFSLFRQIKKKKEEAAGRAAFGREREGVDSLLHFASLQSKAMSPTEPGRSRT